MRLIIFLILLVSLPALADSIDYSGAGSLSDHTAVVTGSPTAGSHWGVADILVEIDNTTTGQVMQGQLGHVDLVTGLLKSCSMGLCFTGGSIDITNTAGKTLFDSAFISGTVSTQGPNTFLNATFAQGGTSMIATRSGSFSSNSVVNQLTTTTPEPSSLMLLGAGLVSLWWVGREKLLKMKV